MRIKLITFLLIAVGQLSAQNLKYNLICLIDTVTLGSEADMSLVISGIDKGFIDKDDNRITYAENSSRVDFSVKPDSIGINIFGPYTIKIDSNEISSNTVQLVVVKPNNIKSAITIYIPDTVNVDSITKLIIINNQEYLDIKLKENDYYKSGHVSKSHYMTVLNGKVKNEYRNTIELEFFKKGELIISRDLFDNLSPIIEIPKKKIIIK